MNVEQIKELKAILRDVWDNLGEDKKDKWLEYSEFYELFIKSLVKKGFGLDIQQLNLSLYDNNLNNLREKTKQGHCRKREIICYKRISSYWGLYCQMKDTLIPVPSE